MGKPKSEETTSDSPFAMILRNFEYSIQGYRLFLDQLRGPLKKAHQQDQSKRVSRIKNTLEAEDQNSVAEALKTFAEGLKSIAERETTTAGPQDENEKVEATFTVDLPTVRSRNAFFKLTDLIWQDRWTGLDAQLERLYRSVIVGLVGQFEVLVSDVAHQFFRRASGALNEEEKTLSLSDLRKFESVEGAREYLIERKIDELLAKPISGWAEFFEKHMNIELEAMARDWKVFTEIIQRRHIIVHADGRISRRYLQSVSENLVNEYFGEARIGQAAPLDRDYVDRALDHFEILGTLLCCTAWVKLDKRSLPGFEDTLVDWVYDRLLEERWEMALAMAEEGMQSKGLTQKARAICRVNAWLCLKRLGRFDDVRDDAEGFDDSALGHQFRLARLAILGREEELLDVLEASKGRDLDYAAWHEWPVFAEIRTNPRFGELAERFAPENESGAVDETTDGASQ